VDQQNTSHIQQFDAAFTNLRDACDMLDDALSSRRPGSDYLKLINKLAGVRLEELQKYAENPSLDIQRKKLASALCQKTNTLLHVLQSLLENPD
jgi:hypothetical protein